MILHGEKLVRPLPGLGGRNREISASRASCAEPRASDAAWACPDVAGVRSCSHGKGEGHASAGGSARVNFPSNCISSLCTRRLALALLGEERDADAQVNLIWNCSHVRAWRDRDSGGGCAGDILKSPRHGLVIFASCEYWVVTRGDLTHAAESPVRRRSCL